MEGNILEKGVLYVVGTPIGNLSDFSPRAAETLAGVDFIAAEDTRVTVKLLNHFGIKKPLVSYFEHNKQEKGTVCALPNGSSRIKTASHAVHFASFSVDYKLYEMVISIAAFLLEGYCIADFLFFYEVEDILLSHFFNIYDLQNVIFRQTYQYKSRELLRFVSEDFSP